MAKVSFEKDICDLRTANEITHLLVEVFTLLSPAQREEEVRMMDNRAYQICMEIALIRIQMKEEFQQTIGTLEGEWTTD